MRRRDEDDRNMHATRAPADGDIAADAAVWRCAVDARTTRSRRG